MFLQLKVNGEMKTRIPSREQSPKPFKRQPHKTVKHIQTVRRQQPTNCLSVLGHFVRLALKRII